MTTNSPPTPLITDPIIARLMELAPVSMQSVEEFHELVFAPWVKAQGLVFLEVEQGRAKARLPQDPQQQFFSGAMCGQALMSAIDTVMSIAMATFDRPSRGTASQNNQFLRPAAGDDLIVEAKVLRAGRTLAYGETFVTFESSGELVAHSTSEFSF